MEIYEGINEIAYEDRIEDKIAAKQELDERKKRLNKKHLQMFNLRYVEGWSNGELAKYLKSSRNSVNVTMSNLRKILKKRLD